MKDIVEKAKGVPFLKALKGNQDRWGFTLKSGFDLELRKHSVAFIWKWEVRVYNSETRAAESKSFRRIKDAFGYFQSLWKKHDMRLIEAKGHMFPSMKRWVDEHLDDETPDES